VYTLILTSRIQSEAHMPLTADARAGNRAFFFHYYSKGFTPDDADSDVDETNEEDEAFGTLDSTGSDSDVAEPAPFASALVPWTELFLSEVYYDCDGDESDGCQFIELAGTPNASISGVQVLIVNGSDGKVQKIIALPEDAVFSDSGYYVVADARTHAALETQVAHADLVLNLDPQNGPDAIQLLDENGAFVDAVGYGEGMVALGANEFPLYESMPALDVEAGHSLCRSEAVDGDVNPTDFFDCIPTPGEENTLLQSEEIEEVEGSNEAAEDIDNVESPTAAEDPVEEVPDSVEGDEVEGQAGKPMPWVIITEVVTDPQQDWNDSAGGDGVPYSAVPGSGTIGATDEWIELYNASGETIDLRGWSLVMSDATPETHVFADGDKIVYFSADSSVEGWLPDDYLIFGNPEGDLKNDALTLTLLDPEGETVDTWFVENGDAQGIDDESWQRFFEDGVELFEEGVATPWE
jgi:hypothetical protein